MKANEFYNLIKQGLKPVIQFNECSDDYIEESVDPYMRCRVIKATKEYDCGYRFEIDLNGFEEYNKTVAQPIWFDSNGVARLTWFESKMYPKDGIDAIYFDANTELPFEIIEDDHNNIFNKYLSEKTTTTYIEWLENIVKAVYER